MMFVDKHPNFNKEIYRHWQTSQMFVDSSSVFTCLSMVTAELWGTHSRLWPSTASSRSPHFSLPSLLAGESGTTNSTCTGSGDRSLPGSAPPEYFYNSGKYFSWFRRFRFRRCGEIKYVSSFSSILFVWSNTFEKVHSSLLLRPYLSLMRHFSQGFKTLQKYLSLRPRCCHWLTDNGETPAGSVSAVEDDRLRVLELSRKFLPEHPTRDKIGRSEAGFWALEE